EARAMELGEPQRMVGPIRPDLQRGQREPQVVDRRRGGGQVVDEVDPLVDEVRLDDVDVPMLEHAVADVLDVGEGSGLERVDADHAVAASQQLFAQMRPEESGASSDQARWHAPGIYLFQRARRTTCSSPRRIVTFSESKCSSSAWAELESGWIWGLAPLGVRGAMSPRPDGSGPSPRARRSSRARASRLGPCLRGRGSSTRPPPTVSGGAIRRTTRRSPAAGTSG